MFYRQNSFRAAEERKAKNAAFIEFPSLALDESKLSPAGSLGIIVSWGVKI